MVGCFGLLDGYHSSYFQRDRLIENRARLDVFALSKLGALTEGAVIDLKWGEKGCHLATRTVDILMNGTPIPLAWDAQGRRWFVCRGCNRRRQHLYLDELLCRRCADLDYSCRHVARSLPGVHRIMRWRRQIGIDWHPFSAIPKRQRHHLRYYRIVAKILAEEAKLIGHLRGINHDLERRIRVRCLGK